MKAKRIWIIGLCVIMCMAMPFNIIPNALILDAKAETRGTSVDDPEAYSPKMDSIIDGTDRSNMSNFLNYTQLTIGYTGTNIRIQTVGAASDPRTYVYFPGGSIDIGKYPVMLIKLRLSENAPTGYQIYYQNTEMTDISTTASLSGQYESTSDWQHEIVNFGSNSNITGVMRELRWDIFSGTDALHYVEVAYIAFFQSVAAAEAFSLHDDFELYDQRGAIEDTTLGVTVTDPASTNQYTFAENGQRGYTETKYTYTMNCSNTPADYWRSNVFGFSGVANATTTDGMLRPNGGGGYTIFTKKMLGDDYALTNGILTFDMSMTNGSATVGSRLVMSSDTTEQSGLHFALSPNGTVCVTEVSSNCSVNISTGKSLSGKHTYQFSDTEKKMELCADGVLLCSVAYNSQDKSFTVYDANGTSKGSFVSETLPSCGYASIQFSGTFSGYADDIQYTHSEITLKKYDAEYNTDYSTWNAVDDQGRTTQTGAAFDSEKYVGVFYFMSHGGGESREAMLDSTKLYLEGGIEKIQTTFESVAGSGGAYWAEPYFGYYRTGDTWILRKHANMLSAAGVDFIYLDLSNNVFYMDYVKLLFDTWLEMRAEGQTTPQICMFYGDNPFYTLNGIYTMYNEIFCNAEYEELLFKYEGKPLVLGNTDHQKENTLLGREWTCYDISYEDFTALVNADANLENFLENDYEEILTKFTIRKSWAYKNYNSDGKNGGHKGYWDWLQYLPQAAGTDEDGNVEQISVSMGIDSHRGLGRSLTDEHFFESNEFGTYDALGQYGFGLSTTAQGLFFQKQFENALKSDAKIMMITGWNEWSAGIIKAAENRETGQASSPGWTLIDQFTPEYSRDGEPMKIRDGEDSVGFGDNYYYQMVSYIRQFKGMPETPATINGGSIEMAGASIDLQWEGINPTFTDGVNDIALRSEYSLTADQRYVNNSARNDIAYAKITQDAEAVYFYAKTAGQLINVDDEGWMNLFIDIDNDPTTGWEGYDIRINRTRTANTAAVERFVDGQWSFEKLGDAQMVLGDGSVTFKVSRSVLGIGTEAVSFNFKWSDISVTDGDIMKFMDLGDAAPDDRFYFTYTASTLTDERADSTELNENIKFYGASVTIDDEYTLNFKVEKSVLNLASTYRIMLSGGNERQEVYMSGKHEIVEKDDKYYFSLGKIGPHQMGDSITATLCAYDEEGTLIGYDKREYSMVQYCTNKLNEDDITPELATTLKDLLNYGAAVQTYLNPSISPDKLANAGLDTDTDTVAPSVSADGFSHTPFENRIGFSSVSVRLNNGVEIVMKVIGSTADIHVSNGEVLSINENGEYVHRINFLKLTDQYIYRVDGAKLTYSIPIYIVRNEGKSNDELTDLMTQLMEFGVSIRAWRIAEGMPVPRPALDPDDPDIWMPEDDVTK